MPSEDEGEENPNRHPYRRHRHQRKNPPFAGIAAFINAYRDEQKANRRQESAEDRGSKSIEKWTLSFVVVTACLIGVQDFILHRSDDAIHKSAEAAVVAANAAQDSLKTVRETAERQLRAYIFPTELTVTDVELGKHPGVNMVVKNTGQTPATDVIAWAGVWVGNFPLRTELIRASPEFMKTASRRPVGPGATFTIIHAWNEALTEQHMKMLQNGTAAVFIWGEITYVDVFGKKRTTNFRNYYGGDAGMRPGGASIGAEDGNNSD